MLFTLATHALPVFVGMTAGLYAHGSGTAPLGAIALGMVTAAFVLVIDNDLSCVHTPILRIAIAPMFVVPAALAGYSATFGLSGLTTTSDVWRQVFAVIGAVAIGQRPGRGLSHPRPADRAGSEAPHYRRLGGAST